MGHQEHRGGWPTLENGVCSPGLNRALRGAPSVGLTTDGPEAPKRHANGGGQAMNGWPWRSAVGQCPVWGVPGVDELPAVATGSEWVDEPVPVIGGDPELGA